MTLRFLLCLFLSKAAFGMGVGTDVLTPGKPILPLSFYASPLSPEGAVFEGDPVYPHTVVLASHASDEDKEASLAALLSLAKDEGLEPIKRVHALEYYLVYSKNPDSKTTAAAIFAGIDHKTLGTLKNILVSSKNLILILCSLRV